MNVPFFEVEIAMKAVMNRLWPHVTRSAAMAALVGVCQLSWAQDDPARPNPPSGERSLAGDSETLSGLGASHDDDSFEQYASLEKLATAWREMDSALMTDAFMMAPSSINIFSLPYSTVAASMDVACLRVCCTILKSLTNSSPLKEKISQSLLS